MNDDERGMTALRREMDQRFRDTERLMTVRFDAQDKAVQKAEEAMTIRLDHMNEFRAQVTEERINYATKAELSALSAIVSGLEGAFNEKLSRVEQQSNYQRGKDMGILGLGLTVVFSLITVGLKFLGL